MAPTDDPWGDRRTVALTPISDRLAAALADLGTDTVWASTWREEANVVLCPEFGWDPLDVLERHPEVLWWKLDSICATHPAGVPFVWVDDELDTRDDELDGLVRLMCDGLDVDYLLICPDRNTGLTPADVATIAEFVASRSRTATLAEGLGASRVERTGHGTVGGPLDLLALAADSPTVHKQRRRAD